MPTAEQLDAMTPRQFKVYENHIRRIANRQLLELRKIGRRDPQAHDFGMYRLIDQGGKTFASGQLRAIHARLISRN